MNKKTISEIIYDREVNGLSYRSLGTKYHTSHNRIYRIVKADQKKQKKLKHPTIPQAAAPDDLKLLKEENRQLRLKLELQDTIIDITSKELGVDIRKKPGTRQS